MSCIDDEISTGYEVVVTYEVCSRCDYSRILMSLTCETDDVRSCFLDSSESLCCSRNSLVYDDSLHERIVGKSCDNADCRLLLFHEVVRICQVLDHTTVCD